MFDLVINKIQFDALFWSLQVFHLIQDHFLISPLLFSMNMNMNTTNMNENNMNTPPFGGGFK